MTKRKVFTKTDLTTPKIEFTRDAVGHTVIPLTAIPPAHQSVSFPPNPTGMRNFHFAAWYGVGVDSITYACQRQIERFLDKQDADVEAATIVSYCKQGLRGFLDYLSLRSAALHRELTLADVNRDLIDGYIAALRDLPVETSTDAASFSATKSVLKALCRRHLIVEIHSGDDRTFPVNPYPGSKGRHKGEKALSKAQRNSFAAAVKAEALPLMLGNAEITGSLLAYAVLVVALHTGRNTTPLLELTPECLIAHPKDSTMFLVLYKRRGHTSHKVALRGDSDQDLGIEAMPSVRANVVTLLRRVIEFSADLRQQAPPHLQNSIWLFRPTVTNTFVVKGSISCVDDGTIAYALTKLVKKYKLVDGDGKPMKINISRLRKTFVNRIFDLLGGDVVGTAMAAGNTVSVTGTNYLRPGEDAESNWRFMGQALVAELLTNTLGATERTPVGNCTDPVRGEYAPKREGAVCMSFFNCLRCRNYVVTGDDLYKLFSFYWRVIRERGRMDKRRWEKQFSHIVRLIDRDVVAEGVRKKIFSQRQVETTRERARNDPHPFWRSDTIVAEIQAMQ